MYLQVPLVALLNHVLQVITQKQKNEVLEEPDRFSPFAFKKFNPVSTEQVFLRKGGKEYFRDYSKKVKL